MPKKKRRTTMRVKKPKAREGSLQRMSDRVREQRVRELKRKKMFAPTRPRSAAQNPLTKIMRQVRPPTPTPGTWTPPKPVTRQRLRRFAARPLGEVTFARECQQMWAC